MTVKRREVIAIANDVVCRAAAGPRRALQGAHYPLDGRAEAKRGCLWSSHAVWQCRCWCGPTCRALSGAGQGRGPPSRCGGGPLHTQHRGVMVRCAASDAHFLQGAACRRPNNGTAGRHPQALPPVLRGHHRDWQAVQRFVCARYPSCRPSRSTARVGRLQVDCWIARCSVARLRGCFICITTRSISHLLVLCPKLGVQPGCG